MKGRWSGGTFLYRPPSQRSTVLVLQSSLIFDHHQQTAKTTGSKDITTPSVVLFLPAVVQQAAFVLLTHLKLTKSHQTQANQEKKHAVIKRVSSAGKLYEMIETAKID